MATAVVGDYIRQMQAIVILVFIVLCLGAVHAFLSGFFASAVTITLMAAGYVLLCGVAMAQERKKRDQGRGETSD